MFIFLLCYSILNMFRDIFQFDWLCDMAIDLPSIRRESCVASEKKSLRQIESS